MLKYYLPALLLALIFSPALSAQERCTTRCPDGQPPVLIDGQCTCPIPGLHRQPIG